MDRGSLTKKNDEKAREESPPEDFSPSCPVTFKYFKNFRLFAL